MQQLQKFYNKVVGTGLIHRVKKFREGFTGTGGKKIGGNGAGGHIFLCPNHGKSNSMNNDP